MKKMTLITIMALGLSTGLAVTATANDGSGVHVSYESGVKVHRGAPLHIDHQAAATYEALRLEELQIKNQNRQAKARLRSETRLNQERLDLDRRIAFTENEIFTNSRSRNGRRFVTRGRNNRFFGVNGISRNTRVSRGFD